MSLSNYNSVICTIDRRSSSGDKSLPCVCAALRAASAELLIYRRNKSPFKQGRRRPLRRTAADLMASQRRYFKGIQRFRQHYRLWDGCIKRLGFSFLEKNWPDNNYSLTGYSTILYFQPDQNVQVRQRSACRLQERH